MGGALGSKWGRGAGRKGSSGWGPSPSPDSTLKEPSGRCVLTHSLPAPWGWKSPRGTHPGGFLFFLKGRRVMEASSSVGEGAEV